MSEEKIFTVAEFNRYIRSLVSRHDVQVKGEITEFSVRKWVSLTIKDVEGNASVRVFGLPERISNYKELEVGTLVKVSGRPNITIKDGSFGIFADEIIPFGEGELLAAYEKTKAKLESEGLFIRKRPIPELPEKLCLLTAKDSDGYHDFITEASKRRPDLEIIFYPVVVQGAETISSIASAFAWVNKSDGLSLDLVVLTRGGGSMEDLYPFNTEELARVVFSSKIPVICGIGHERNVPLADLVADGRAPNPQGAAELATQLERDEVLRTIERHLSDMEASFNLQLERGNTEITHNVNILEQYFSKPIAKLESLEEKIILSSRFLRQNVKRKLESIDTFVSDTDKTLDSIFRNRSERLAELKRYIRGFDPKLALSRGFSITRINGEILKSAKKARVGTKLKTELRSGKVVSEVI